MSNEESSGPSEDDYALMILRNRLAKGEITIEEFNALSKTLLENRTLQQLKTRESKYDSEGHASIKSSAIQQDVDITSNVKGKDQKGPLAASEERTYNTEVFTIKMVQPKISSENIINYAKETATKNSKGGFLGRGKIFEKALAWELFFYPYYDLEIEETIQATEKRGWFKKESVTKNLATRVSFDAVTGAVIDVTDKGISYVYAFLNNLNQDEINLLYYTSSINKFSMQSLRGLGHSDAKARRLADGLAANGILIKHNTRPATYQQINRYPTKPTAFMSLMKKYHPDKTVQSGYNWFKRRPTGKRTQAVSECTRCGRHGSLYRRSDGYYVFQHDDSSQHYITKDVAEMVIESLRYKDADSALRTVQGNRSYD